VFSRVLIAGLIILAQLAPLSAAPAVNTEPAANLRAQMEALYGESALLSWSAVLLAPTAKKASEGPFHDAIGALDDNAGRLGRLYGQIYGDRVGADFTALWKRLNAAFASYAQAAAMKNDSGKTGASAALDAFPGQLAGMLSPLAKGHPGVDELKSDFAGYVGNLRAVADRQAARDFNTEYRALDDAYAAIRKIAHGQATGAQLAFPTRYVGSMDLPAVNLRVSVNALFTQQVFTIAMANRANYASNIDEYYALYARYDLLTDQISRELGAYGGNDFASQFSALWKKFTASLGDYEKARELQDNTMQKRVLGDISSEEKELTALFVPPAPTHAVGPPKKGKKPKTPPQPPFYKDVKAYMDANVAVIYAATRKQSPFGPLQRAWTDSRRFTDSLCSLMVGRFGDKPQNATEQSEGK
jgi:hypothetical protein